MIPPLAGHSDRLLPWTSHISQGPQATKPPTFMIPAQYGALGHVIQGPKPKPLKFMILALYCHSGRLLVWASHLKGHKPEPPMPMIPTLDGHSDRPLLVASHIPKGSKPGLAKLMIRILACHSGHPFPWASHIPYPSSIHRRS